MANSNVCLEAARKAFPDNENLRVAYMLGFNAGFDKMKVVLLEWAKEVKTELENLHSFENNDIRKGAIWELEEVIAKIEAL